MPSSCSHFEHPLSAGQVAERCGVAISTLHRCEAKGLIRSQRNPGNQRRYPREVLRRVAIIKVAQRLGIPLADFGAALATLPRDHTPNAADWQQLSEQWQRDLEARIEQLTRVRNQLTGCIGCDCLSMQDCPLRNPWDQLGKQGPGPRLLEPS